MNTVVEQNRISHLMGKPKRKSGLSALAILVAINAAYAHSKAKP